MMKFVTTLIFLFLLASFNSCSDSQVNSENLPDGEHKIFLKGHGFVRGKIKEIETFMRSKYTNVVNRATCTIDLKSKITITIDHDYNTKTYDYYDADFRLDSSRNENGTEKTIYLKVPFYHYLPLYEFKDGIKVHSNTFKLDSTGSGWELSWTGREDTSFYNLNSYNKDGLYIGSRTIKDGKFIHEYIYEYDSAGEIKREIYKGQGDDHTMVATNYKYDDRGNWIQKDLIYQFASGKTFVTNMERKFTYR